MRLVSPSRTPSQLFCKDFDCIIFEQLFLLNNFPLFRNSPPDVFIEKGVLKLCSKFTGEHLCRSVMLIKLFCNFTEITLGYGCSPVNSLHIFRTPFPKNTSKGRLLSVSRRKNIFYEIMLIELWIFQKVFVLFKYRNSRSGILKGFAKLVYFHGKTLLNYKNS